MPRRSTSVFRNDSAPQPETPRWNDQRRELWFGERLVKRFRRPAPNQELILVAFEEEGWSAVIADPLPRVSGTPARERLHEAVRRLNGCQKEANIRFEMDGSGRRVLWSVVK